jgi:hypothetical protein
MGLFKKEKKEIIESREALIEMYKAGFLDGYKIGNKARSKKDFIILNRLYKKAFMKRFGKQINRKLK